MRVALVVIFTPVAASNARSITQAIACGAIGVVVGCASGGSARAICIVRPDIAVNRASLAAVVTLAIVRVSARVTATA